MSSNVKIPVRPGNHSAAASAPAEPSTALVGCRTVTEVEDNVAAADGALSDADLAEIEACFARHGVDPVPDRWIEDI